MKGHGWKMVALALAASANAAAATPARPSSCLACHGDTSLFDAEAVAKVKAFGQDVHAEVGLSCQDCHGGNPDPALAGDSDAAMDKKFKPNPFRGALKRPDIPAACGRCHSDPAYMKRFNPSLRVDQEREYWTSHHGKALKRPDRDVATCVDCHGVHGILRPGNPSSPVHPTHIADTCGRCHSDPERMAGRQTADGRPLPVDQRARWRQSVHAAALLDRGDLSAPTCNDCHGNHGATPPGLDSISLVCGQCHGREAQLFRGSAKRTAFETHNDLLAQSSTRRCSECHESGTPADTLGVSHLSECASCHGNHDVVRPTVALLSPLPQTPCAFCHEGPDSVATDIPEPEAKRRHYQELRDALLAEAGREQVQGDERFNWLVDKALVLPVHTVAGTATGTQPPRRPEFDRLFAKFRIGKTYHTHPDAVTGKPVRTDARRCGLCHEDKNGPGLTAAADFLQGMRELTALTARAERIVLAARRGGVETRGALLEIDRAVDAQIELQVLVHAFSIAPEGAFAKKRSEGLDHARSALSAGQRALEEMSSRRTGLVVSLVLILFVLLGLALKIRQVGPTS